MKVASVDVVFDVQHEVLIKNDKRLKIMSTADSVQYENLLPVGEVMERAAQYHHN